jgi:hypothetical protein
MGVSPVVATNQAVHMHGVCFKRLSVQKHCSHAPGPVEPYLVSILAATAMHLRNSEELPEVAHLLNNQRCFCHHWLLTHWHVCICATDTCFYVLSLRVVIIIMLPIKP